MLAKLELDFYPANVFIEGNRLMVLGAAATYRDLPPEALPQYGGPSEPPGASGPIDEADVVTNDLVIRDEKMIAPGFSPGYDPKKYPVGITVAKIYDVSDRANPVSVRTIELEGYPIAARKIADRVYLVISSYPDYYALQAGRPILPVFRDSTGTADFAPVAPCTDIRYLPPIQPEGFLTVSAFSLTQETPLQKDTVVGSGQNVYASPTAIYVAQTSHLFAGLPIAGVLEGVADVVFPTEPAEADIEPAVEPIAPGEPVPEPVPRPEPVAPAESTETTTVFRFSLGESVTYHGKFEAPGRILNQFSMDENSNSFRIATTKGFQKQTNNVYIFDLNSLQRTGALEGLAPGEQIYAVRFLGDRAYMVTFRTVDPLFVLDLADPSNPRVLGELKIPGYSAYLHPYDEPRIIGIGKEAIDQGDFAITTGLKMALFDVSDVANPKQLHGIQIGDRGTESEVLYDHKAFLFDKAKSLLAIPITVSKIPDNSPESWSQPVSQGLHVFRLTAENGFEPLGQITHLEPVPIGDELVTGDSFVWYQQNYHVRRSLFIGDVLYAVSNGKITANQLPGLEQLATLEFKEASDYPYPTLYRKDVIGVAVGEPGVPDAAPESQGV